MKNKTTSLLLFLAISLYAGGLLISCHTGNHYTRQTAALDSINRLEHLADSALMLIDSVKIKQCANHAMAAIELVKMANVDSMSKGAADIFRNISSVRWALETFVGRRAVMLSEMRKSMNRLTNLSHDLRYNLIKADSVPVFYNEEVKVAALLIESEKTSVVTLNAQLPLYYILAPQADSLLTLIKNHKEI